MCCIEPKSLDKPKVRNTTKKWKTPQNLQFLATLTRCWQAGMPKSYIRLSLCMFIGEKPWKLCKTVGNFKHKADNSSICIYRDFFLQFLHDFFAETAKQWDRWLLQILCKTLWSDSVYKRTVQILSFSQQNPAHHQCDEKEESNCYHNDDYDAITMVMVMVMMVVTIMVIYRRRAPPIRLRACTQSIHNLALQCRVGWTGAIHFMRCELKKNGKNA